MKKEVGAGDISEKVLLRAVSETLLFMFSFSLMDLGLTFKSLIYFEFIIVYGVSRWPRFIFSMCLSCSPNIY